MLRITHMLATTAFSELYITVSRQQGTFLSNRCINEMHYTYQITRRQVSSFASPRYDFAAKHISRKMLHSYSFFFSLKENWSDSVDSLRSLAGLILCWKEKEEKLRSFLHWNIPWFTTDDQASVEKLKHTLAKLRHTGTLIDEKCPKYWSLLAGGS